MAPHPNFGEAWAKDCSNLSNLPHFLHYQKRLKQAQHIDKQKMAERLKEDICRLVGKQEFDVAYARWLDLQIVLKDLEAGDE